MGEKCPLGLSFLQGQMEALFASFFWLYSTPAFYTVSFKESHLLRLV